MQDEDQDPWDALFAMDDDPDEEDHDDEDDDDDDDDDEDDDEEGLILGADRIQ